MDELNVAGPALVVVPFAVLGVDEEGAEVLGASVGLGESHARFDFLLLLRDSFFPVFDERPCSHAWAMSGCAMCMYRR